MIRKIGLYLVLFSICGLYQSCRSTNNFSGDDRSIRQTDPGTKQDSQVSGGVLSKYEGIYVTECKDYYATDGAKSVSHNEKLIIQNNTLTYESINYWGQKCSGDLKNKSTLQYNIVEVKENGGGIVINRKILKATQVSYDQSEINGYNSSKEYGFSDWKVGEIKDISGTLGAVQSEGRDYFKFIGSSLYSFLGDKFDEQFGIRKIYNEQ